MFPYEIHCTLPKHGEKIRVCFQFFCHTLKIPEDVIKWHHERMWEICQKEIILLPPNNAFNQNPTNINQTNLIDSNMSPKYVKVTHYISQKKCPCFLFTKQSLLI